MGIINAIITFCVGLILLGGAAMTYHYREADQRLVQNAPNAVRVQNAVNAARADIANANASLPKWDNTNYKGLAPYRPPSK